MKTFLNSPKQNNDNNLFVASQNAWQPSQMNQQFQNNTGIPHGQNQFSLESIMGFDQSNKLSQNYHYQEYMKKLKDLFSEMKTEVQNMDTDPDLFKNHQLPLARIKKIMKSDEDVRMISAETPVLFAKACEIFIIELTFRAQIHTEENKRRTLQRSDIAACIANTDIFDFLIDIIPKEEYKQIQLLKHNDQFQHNFNNIQMQNSIQQMQNQMPLYNYPSQQVQQQLQTLDQSAFIQNNTKQHDSRNKNQKN